MLIAWMRIQSPPCLFNLNPWGCKEEGVSGFWNWFGGRIRGRYWAAMRSKVWAWSWVAIIQFWWRLCGYHGRVGICGIVCEDVKIMCVDIWRLRGLSEILRIMRPASWWLWWRGQIMDYTWGTHANRAYETEPAYYGRFRLGICSVVPWRLADRGYGRMYWLRTEIHDGSDNCTIACWERMWFSTLDLGWVRMVQVSYAQLRCCVGWGLGKGTDNNQSSQETI